MLELTSFDNNVNYLISLNYVTGNACLNIVWTNCLLEKRYNNVRIE